MALHSTNDSTSKVERAALVSVFAALGVAAVKIVVGVTTGSLIILGEAAHTLFDLLASVITIFAVRYARKPADEDHAYGHGKLENITGLGQALLLLGACGFLVYEASLRLMDTGRHPVEATFWMFAVLALDIVVNFWRSRSLARTAREHRSMALEADALHFASDLWGTLFSLAGIILVAYGVPSADNIAGIAVAVFVATLAVRLGKRALDELLDRVPEGLTGRIRELALLVPNVERITNIRVRNAGSSTFIDCSIAIPRHLSFQEAHGVVHRVEDSIKRELPHVDILIHADPIASERETIAEKVRMAVVPLGVRIHDVEVHLLGEHYHIDLHLDSDPSVTFRSAHEITDEIIRLVRRELSEASEVVVHIDAAREIYARTADVTNEEKEIVVQVQSAISSDLVHEAFTIFL